MYSFVVANRKKLPDVVSSSFDEKFIIDTYAAELKDFDLDDESLNRLEIAFISQEFTLLDNFGENLLLVEVNLSGELASGVEIKEVFQLKLTDDIFISHYTAENQHEKNLLLTDKFSNAS
jgi:hypothetical protein